MNGKITVLSRFISKAIDKCIPFFDALNKGKKNFEWSKAYLIAFEELLRHMETPPILSKPVNGEDLFVYLAVSPHALSAALMREDTRIQQPVYYLANIHWS